MHLMYCSGQPTGKTYCLCCGMRPGVTHHRCDASQTQVQRDANTRQQHPLSWIQRRHFAAVRTTMQYSHRNKKMEASIQDWHQHTCKARGTTQPYSIGASTCCTHVTTQLPPGATEDHKHSAGTHGSSVLQQSNALTGQTHRSLKPNTQRMSHGL